MRPARLFLVSPLVAAGCASILGFPDVPEIGDGGPSNGACCDAGLPCVGPPCEDSTADASQTDAAPVDDSDGPFSDAPIDAQATEGGDDSETEAAGDDTAIDEPTGDDASVDVGNADGAPIESGADADGRAHDAPDSPPDEPDVAQEDSLALGLVALYHFDEASGTTSADSSGNGHTAMMIGGATFSPGVSGNAATLSGANQYVMLPEGIVSALTNFSISGWIYQNRGAVGYGDRLFDFGTGTMVNMFITTDGDALRYAVTTGGHPTEENLLTSGTLPLASWQHLAVTLAGATGTLYRNGTPVKSGTTTLDPAALGVTTQNWIGRSQYPNDHYLDGLVDEFRIYNRALSAAEVMELYGQRR
jgi:concanavalin A-like lectin/glucanase superfamily protein